LFLQKLPWSVFTFEVLLHAHLSHGITEQCVLTGTIALSQHKVAKLVLFISFDDRSLVGVSETTELVRLSANFVKHHQVIATYLFLLLD
jgi:hypothetical protein